MNGLRAHCNKCRMSFQVGEPRDKRSQSQRCPDCHLVFWEVMIFDKAQRKKKNLDRTCVIVGITPKQYKQWKGFGWNGESLD